MTKKIMFEFWISLSGSLACTILSGLNRWVTANGRRVVYKGLVMPSVHLRSTPPSVTNWHRWFATTEQDDGEEHGSGTAHRRLFARAHSK
jgi:hypothetical protein